MPEKARCLRRTMDWCSSLGDYYSLLAASFHHLRLLGMIIQFAFSGRSHVIKCCSPAGERHSETFHCQRYSSRKAKGETVVDAKYIRSPRADLT